MENPMSDQSTGSSLQSDASVGAFEFGNLMALASLDTSDLKAQISRLPKEGIYVVDLAKLGFAEQPPQDPADPMSFNLVGQSVIRQFVPLKEEDAATAADLEGENLNERIFLWGQQIK